MWREASQTRPGRIKYATESERIAAAKEKKSSYRLRQQAADPAGFNERARLASKRYREKHPGRSVANTLRSRDIPKNREYFNAYRRKWRAENIVRALWKDAQRRSKQKGIEFTIELGDIPPMGNNCPLLGLPFSMPGDGRSSQSPSLDRIDSAKGYVRGNVWVVGYRANLIKNDGTAEEHEAIARAMREALGKPDAAA